MKTYAFYGFGGAFLGLLMNAILFFTGVHTDPAKFNSSSTIINILGILIAVGVTFVGVRDVRDSRNEAEAFTYANGFKAAILISLFAAVGGVVSHLIYTQVINTGFSDLMLSAQVQQMRAKGVPEEHIQGAMEMGKKFSHPAIAGTFVFMGAMIFGTLVSLVVPIFTRRPAAVPVAPPPIA